MKNSYPIRDENKINELEKNGVIFVDRNNVYISSDVTIGEGTVIFPNVYLWNSVSIGKNCVIQTSTMINDNVKILDNVFIGPSCLIRTNTMIGINCLIGPHCEITRSILGVECKLGHKNFVGDAILNDGVKFGAGAIIANSNWNESFKTYIGNDTLVGVNSSLIAPLRIGKNCLIAAGSTITDDSEDNKLLLARCKQVSKDKKK